MPAELIYVKASRKVKTEEILTSRAPTVICTRPTTLHSFSANKKQVIFYFYYYKPNHEHPWSLRRKRPRRSYKFWKKIFDSKQVLMLLTCLINDAEQSPPVFTTHKLQNLSFDRIPGFLVTCCCPLTQRSCTSKTQWPCAVKWVHPLMKQLVSLVMLRSNG